MNKIKTLFNKVKARPIWYLIVLTFIVIILNCILGIIGLRFRNWVFMAIFIILVVGILIKGTQKFIKQSVEFKSTIGILLCILVFLGTVFFRVTALILFLILLTVSSFFPNAEHVVTKNGVKCVAVVHSGFLDTDVDYYKYVNFLVMGNKKIDTEYHKGSYDPIEREVEENEREKENRKADNFVSNNLQNTIKQETTKKEEIIEEKDIIYIQEINSTTSIRIVDRGNVLGQKKIIQIQKSTDNGKTWNNTLKTSDGAITVNNEAKFSFINERVRFY